MANVRQLAHLYLRGALANETMKHLTDAQKEHAEEICDAVLNHSALSGHKYKFMEKLGATIRCDYSDTLMAEQEYRITIWRGVIYLLYHHQYSYICAACNETSYPSQRGKMIKLDRRWKECPACKCCAIDEPGDSDYKPGDIISADDHGELIMTMTSLGKKPPTTRSCVEPIKGQKKVKKPQQVLEDPSQLKKFFGEFIWNYFRQSLNENKIADHGKHTRKLTGPLDTVVIEWIVQLLKVHNIPFHCDRFEPKAGYFDISFGAMSCHQYFFHDLALMYARVRHEFGGDVHFMMYENRIAVRDMWSSAPIVELDIAINDRVQMLTNSVPKNDDEGQTDVVQQLERKDMQGIAEVESEDVITTIREALPDGDCQAVLDLITNRGEIYNRFAAQFPDGLMGNHGVPRQNRMAQFLNCGPKDIKRCQKIIALHAQAHGIGL